MTTTPELWIVAGPNGAGKTTCVQKEPIASLLPKVAFLNPDDRTRSKLLNLGYSGFVDAPVDVQTSFFMESADEVEAELWRSVEEGMKVGVETVLSTEKYRAIVERVLALSGRFYLIYVSVSSPGICIDRVAHRVSRGGHGIPSEKIESRFQRSLSNLAWFAGRSRKFWILDNSDSRLEASPFFLATGSRGTVNSIHTAASEAIKSALSPLPHCL